MPTIDVATLFLIAIALFGLMGVMLTVTWFQNRAETAVLHWATAYGLAMPAAALLVGRGRLSDLLSVFAANLMLQVAFGLFVVGVLRFDGRRVPTAVVAIGPLIWALACAFPAFYESFPARMTLMSLLIAGHDLVAGASLWRARRDEALPSRGFVVAILVLLGLTHLVRIPLLGLAPETITLTTLNGSWIAMIGAQIMLQTVLLGHALMAIAKERGEFRHRRSAEIDPLTGVFNRRAFIERAGRQLAQSGDRAALLVFDLDRFKSINDTWGHAAGDRVLAAFAELVETHLGPNDVFGRWGGEEFALLLGETDFLQARRLAEAIRRDFAGQRLVHESRVIPATVSVGLSAAALVGHDLTTLIASADAGLYVAKGEGRDRVAVEAESDAYERAIRFGA